MSSIEVKTKRTKKPVKEFCVIVDCEHKTAPYVDRSDYLVVRTSNVRNGTLVFDDMKFTTAQAFDEWTKRAVPAIGDVLFTREAPAGEACLVPPHFKVCMGQRMVLLKCDRKHVEPGFFLNWFLSDEGRRQIHHFSIGSTVTRINIEDIGEFLVSLPTLSEQQKIAAFLTVVDGRIEQLSRKKALLEAYKKGVMQQLFTQTLRFQDDHGHDFPDWEEKTLGEVCRIRTGKKDVNEGNPGGAYPFFTCAKKHTYSDSYSFDATAILIAGNGDVGHCQFFSGKFEAYQRTYVLTDFESSVDYIFLYLNHFFRAVVDQQKQMGAMPYIKLGMLTDFVIPFPSSIEEQTKIAGFLSALDGKIGAVGEQMRQTQAWKKGLLQQMFV